MSPYHYLGWVDNSHLPDNITICMVDALVDAPTVKRCIVIRSDLSWTVTVHGNSCRVLSTIPPTLQSVKSCKSLLTLVATSNVCTGHSDQHFILFLEA